MTTGLIGKADLAANTVTAIGAALDEKVVLNVRFANRTADVTRVSTAITAGGAPVDADWVTYDYPVKANHPYEDTGLHCSAGERVYVRATTDDVSVRVHAI